MDSKLCALCPFIQTEPASVSGNGWTAYHGDSREVLRRLPPNSIDILASDPPYGTGANSTAGRLKSTSEKYRSTGATPLPDFDGDSLLPEAWETMMNEVLRLSFKALKPGANVILFCDWRSYPGFFKLVSSNGFIMRAVPTWDKGRGSRPMKNGFRSQSEWMIWAKKPGKLESNAEPVYLDGVLKFSTLSNKKVHITQKPVPLMKELLRIAPPGGTVLDPFQGSGTTGVAAQEMGLTYIGIESTSAYHAIACERLSNSLAA